jgi:hypothetical protein
VSFGASPASSVNVGNSTTVTAVTPAHVEGSVDVTVTNPGGVPGTLANGFTFVQPLTVSLTPVSQVIPLRGSGTITLQLSADAPTNLNVTLAASDSAVATVPSAASIPAGSSSTTVPVHGVAPGGPVTITARVPTQLGGGQASAQVTVEASYLIPSVAHNSGLAGSRWFTDIAVANPSSSAVTFNLEYTPRSGAVINKSFTLTGQATVEWRNVIEALFGLATDAESQGVVKIVSPAILAIAARTYNQSTTGTFGQDYPVLTPADALASGELAYLPQLKKTADFRTNIGIANLGNDSCSVRFRFFRADGTAIGEKVITAAVGRWEQQTDVFANIGAGTPEIAYATVEITTPNGLAWAYASLIDGKTNDPTTIRFVN